MAKEHATQAYLRVPWLSIGNVWNGCLNDLPGQNTRWHHHLCSFATFNGSCVPATYYSRLKSTQLYVWQWPTMGHCRFHKLLSHCWWNGCFILASATTDSVRLPHIVNRAYRIKNNTKAITWTLRRLWSILTEKALEIKCKSVALLECNIIAWLWARHKHPLSTSNSRTSL